MACVARCLCVVTLFVCRACLSWLEERENSSRDSPGRFRAQDFDPLGLKPEDPEALKEMQTKESRAASKTTTLLFVCVASMAWSRVVCVLSLCVALVSRLDERTRSATHPGGFAQAPARPPRHARGRRHDRPGAPDGRHALLSACGDGPAASAMDAPRHQVFLPQ